MVAPIRYADAPEPPLEERQPDGASNLQARCPECGTFAAVFAIVLTTEGWRCDGCISDRARKGEPLTMAST